MKDMRTFKLSWMVILLMVVVGLTVFTGRGLHGSVLEQGGYSVLFLAFYYLNLFLVLALGFLVVRNLVRLWTDRRLGRAGSRLRTRMAVLFGALSLLPTLVIAVLSVELLNRGVDSWFSDRIAQALEQSLEVGRAYYRESQRTVKHDAEDIVRNRNITSAVTLEDVERATEVLEVERRLRGLDEIVLYQVNGTRVASAGGLPLDPLPDFNTLDQTRNRALLITSDNGNRVRAFLRLGDSLILSVGRWIDRQALDRMESMERAYKDYHQLRDAHGLLKLTHTLTLVLITLLLLLAAVWSGLRIADSITNPITTLVLGTRKVASGDLSVTIPVLGEDELATLMAAFNAMTQKLSENRKELQNNYALLEERRRFMEAIVQNISAAVISVNRLGRITLTNSAAQRLLGVVPEQAAEFHYQETLPEAVLTVVEGLLRQKAVGEGGRSAQFRLEGGEKPLTLLARVTPLQDEEGEGQGFVATFDDLTEVLVAQRAHAWSDVARRIAHEIKNPLTPIQLSAQRMRRRYLEKEGCMAEREGKVLDECTNTIIQQVEELRVLVNEFSTFARLPRPNLRRDDLNPAIKEVLVLMQGELNKVKSKVELQENLPSILCDRGQIKQVVSNLVNNALAAILGEQEVLEEKGSLEVSTSLSDNGQWVHVTVADSGPGISPADRDRVFEPYFTTKKKGTGLGLAIVKRIVEDHGGALRIRESKWGGAQVEVTLPVGGPSRTLGLEENG